MLCDVDYFFNYSSLVRFLLLHKLNCFGNTFELPFLQALVLSFSVKDMVELDDVRTFNYLFVFRFFFGNRSFFTNYRSLFSLGRTYYSFQLQSFFLGRFAYSPLMFLVNDLLFTVSRKHFRFFFHGAEFNLSLYDMNLFLEKKNNVALYNLRDFLRFRFFFSQRTFGFYEVFLNLLKVI